MIHPIRRLRDYVLQSSDLTEPLNYFFKMVEGTELVDLDGSSRVIELDENDELLAVIEVVQQQLNNHFSIDIEIGSPLFCQIPTHHFFHGAHLSEGLSTRLVVIYFSDVQPGIFAVADEQTEIFRFALTKGTDRYVVH